MANLREGAALWDVIRKEFIYYLHADADISIPLMSHLTIYGVLGGFIFGFGNSKIARGGSTWFNFAHSYL